METQVKASVQPDVQQEQLVAWVVSDYDYVRPKRREIRKATIAPPNLVELAEPGSGTALSV